MGAPASMFLRSATIPGKMAYSAPNMTNTTSVAIHSQYNNMLVSGGKVYTTGGSINYQNGAGKYSYFALTPFPVRIPGDPYIVYASISLQSAIALDSDGVVYGWGANGNCKFFI